MTKCVPLHVWFCFSTENISNEKGKEDYVKDLQ